MANGILDKMTRRQLRALLGELAEVAGAHIAASEAIIALAKTGRPIDRRTLDKLIDLLLGLHVQAAQKFGVAWPRLIHADSPLRNDYSERKQP